jgi:ubiquinone/menaquinone biosynthesis C-methylase UbiE
MLKIEESYGPLFKNFLPTSYHWSRRYEYPWILQRLAEIKPEKILDAGAGTTPLQFYLAQFHEVHSVDIDQNLIKQNHIIKNLLGLTNIHLKTLDITQLDYPDNYFDVVMCISVLEHVSSKHWITIVNEFKRVCKPNGSILITVDLKVNDELKIPRESPFLNMCTHFQFQVEQYPKYPLIGYINKQATLIACINLLKTS